MTEIQLIRDDDKATAILAAVAQIDAGAELAPVVRCKDCVWYQNGKRFEDMKFCCRMRAYNGERARYVWPEDGFCSYGERKDDAET